MSPVGLSISTTHHDRHLQNYSCPLASNVAAYIVSGRCCYICIGMMSKSRSMCTCASKPRTGLPVTTSATRTRFVLGKQCSALLHKQIWTYYISMFLFNDLCSLFSGKPVPAVYIYNVCVCVLWQYFAAHLRSSATAQWLRIISLIHIQPFSQITD